MAVKRRWSELPVPARIGVMILAAAQLILQGVALRDLSKRPAAAVRGPKKLWAAVSFLNFIGPLAYLRWGRRPASR